MHVISKAELHVCKDMYVLGLGDYGNNNNHDYFDWCWNHDYLTKQFFSFENTMHFWASTLVFLLNTVFLTVKYKWTERQKINHTFIKNKNNE